MSSAPMHKNRFRRQGSRRKQAPLRGLKPENNRNNSTLKCPGPINPTSVRTLRRLRVCRLAKPGGPGRQEGLQVGTEVRWHPGIAGLRAGCGAKPVHGTPGARIALASHGCHARDGCRRLAGGRPGREPGVGSGSDSLRRRLAGTTGGRRADRSPARYQQPTAGSLSGKHPKHDGAAWNAYRGPGPRSIKSRHAVPVTDRRGRQVRKRFVD